MFGKLNNQQVHHDSINQKVNDEERLYCHEEHVFEGEEEDPGRQNPHDVCTFWVEEESAEQILQLVEETVPIRPPLSPTPRRSRLRWVYEAERKRKRLLCFIYAISSLSFG